MKKILVLGSTKELEDKGLSQHCVYEEYSKGAKFEFANFPSIDLNVLPLPYKDDEFDGVFASHILEHTIPHQLLDLMKELNRITKTKSEIVIYVPHFSNESALAPITHYTVFGKDTFNQICDNAGGWQNYMKGYFNLKSSKINIPPRFFFCKWVSQSTYEAKFARFFPSSEIRFVLENIK